MFKKQWFKWVLPLAFLIALAPWSEKLDCFVSQSFFIAEHGTFSKSWLHYFIYDWGYIPALIVGLTSGLVFILSYMVERLHKFRFPCLFLAASMAIGAGLLTHLVFKEFWFRPRPVQTVLFGGPHLFHPFYIPKFSFPNYCKSFPSGHATMGFYFINLILLGIRMKSVKLKQIGIATTIIFSSLLCFSRVAQGAHFLSDVLMSCVVTWYAALAIEKLVFDYLAKNKWLSYIKN